MIIWAFSNDPEADQFISQAKTGKKTLHRQQICDFCLPTIFFRSPLRSVLAKHLATDHGADPAAMAKANALWTELDSEEMTSRGLGPNQKLKGLKMTPGRVTKANQKRKQINPEGKRRYGCYKCDKEFPDVDTFNFHIDQCLKIGKKCPKCKSVFYTDGKLLGHGCRGLRIIVKNGSPVVVTDSRR